MAERPVVLYANHVSETSGAERGLLDILALLDRARFDPVLALPGPGPLARQAGSMGVRVVTLPLPRFTRSTPPVRLVRLWTRGVLEARRFFRGERVDLVHANSSHAHLVLAPAARLAGVPAIWHARDLAPLGLAGRLAFRLATRIIAISPAVESHLAGYGRARGRIVRIDNGARLDSWPRPAYCGRAFRARWGLPIAAPVAVMAAQLVPWKEHALFLEAAALAARDVPEMRFVVAGADLFGDHPGFRRELEAACGRLGIADRTLFTGRLADMPSLYAAATMLVHSASREPFGRVLVEAMAASRPVAAVNAGGPRDIVVHGVTGLLSPPGDAAALAVSMKTLARDPALAARLGAAGRRRAEERYDARRMVREIEAVYAEALGRR